MKTLNSNKTKIYTSILLVLLIIVLSLILVILIYEKSKDSSKDNLEQNISLSSDTQKKIMNKNKQNMNKYLNENIPYVIDKELGVYLPVYDFYSNSNTDKLLEKGGVTYPQYGSPDKNNFIVFAHNSQIEGTYFTPFVNNLSIGDTVDVKYKNYQGKIITNTYKITSKKVINYKDVNFVYQKTEQQTITLGTCEVPYDTPNRIIWKGKLISSQ